MRSVTIAVMAKAATVHSGPAFLGGFVVVGTVSRIRTVPAQAAGSNVETDRMSPVTP